MDVSLFSQLGIGLSTLVILWFVVKYFIEAMTKKDEYIIKLVEQFNTTINNHIQHQTAATEANADALKELTKAIANLTKGVNGNFKNKE
jgi:hypothetical protein